MRRFRTVVLPIIAGVIGLGLVTLGIMQMWGHGIVVQGSMLDSSTLEVPDLAPLVEVTVGVVLCVVALLLTFIRPREREHTAAVATAGQAPLIVSHSEDEVTFIWGDAGRNARRRGTSRAAADTV
ncbi:hypothetical protein F8O01_00645 [Pseudoclavibacter chungangensis]|uniref:Uncharacterized protein n=1 Tax=Pseudoclavibacter chungangensis TaxID=587635 RepID=A0A7J5C3Y5_9MICO|nr:hypothetical protein [Pseudoclavibacter chungangensis]KAB1662490.1 hypothetical protein F8O01_00645 [Pseudoclavibacter chungangensis]NYJ68526.1 hypothetical protein [Pseudoclavibacter chungangensis]